jgi:hypothetical protein
MVGVVVVLAGAVGAPFSTSSRVATGPGVVAAPAEAPVPAGLRAAIHRALGPGAVGMAAAPMEREPTLATSDTPNATLSNSAAAVGDRPDQPVAVAAGYSVALSADGATALVGAPAVSSNRGAAYVFRKGAGSWATSDTPTATLTYEYGTSDDRFGSSVALSADGATALIGADGVTSYAGAAYVFTVADAWATSDSPTAFLIDSYRERGDSFGSSVALSADGATALVGAPGKSGDREEAHAQNGGAAYVFRKAAESWTPDAPATLTVERVAKLTDSAAAAFDQFGSSVALSADGATALVGAPRVSPNPGKAYVFAVTGAGSWATSGTPSATLRDSSTVGFDRAGFSVALSGDGATALVGAPGASSGRGAAYVFAAADAASWATSGTPSATLRDSAAAVNDRAGSSVALSGDGATALVGAPGVNGDQGEAYVFRRDAASWTTSDVPSATLRDSAGDGNDRAGDSVALSSDGASALVGADGVSSSRGTAYVFASPSPTVTSVSPTSGPADGGTSVTVTGTGFTGATGVTFGATPGTALVVNGPTSITVTSPAGSGTVDVQVTTAAGTSPTAGGTRFTYEPTSSTTTTTSTTTPTTTGSKRDRDSGSGATVPAGGSASSDPPGTVPSPDTPLIASVTSPVGGDVTFTRTTGGPPLDGYSVLDYGVVITAPEGTMAAPLVMDFEVAADTLPAGATVSSFTVFRNGVPIGPCSASVDPCVASRTLTNGVIRITVRTSHASTWTFASAKVSRVAGADRVRTAVAASRSAFADRSASAVVLARADGFADALAGGPLAAAKDGPLLLTPGAELDIDVLDEVQRVLGDSGTAFVLGGPAAISDTAVASLRVAGVEVVRLAGPNRYATAVAVAERGLGNPQTVIEVSGHDFPDTLSAGPAAAEIGAAILLTDGARQAPATAAHLAARSPNRFAIGTDATAADPAAVSIAGSDRYATAVAVMHRFFPRASTALVASGETYADGLSASATAAKLRVPLLLVPGSGQLPPSLTATVRGLGRVALLGGPAAIDNDIADAITAAVVI